MDESSFNARQRKFKRFIKTAQAEKNECGRILISSLLNGKKSVIDAKKRFSIAKQE